MTRKPYHLITRLFCAVLTVFFLGVCAPLAYATSDDTPKDSLYPVSTSKPTVSATPDAKPSASAQAQALPTVPVINGVAKISPQMLSGDNSPLLPTVSISRDTVLSVSGASVYDFASEGWGGVGLNGDILPFELYYGIYAKTVGGKLYYKAYTHTEGVTPLSAAIIRRNSTGKAVRIPDLNGAHLQTVDLSSLDNDTYNIAVMFSNQSLCQIPLYVNDGHAYIVRSVGDDTQKVIKDYLYHSDKIAELAQSFGVTPENSLALDGNSISYPYPEGYSTWRCDNELWRATANKIVPDKSLPDSLKVAMVHDWMTENLAYDYYVALNIRADRAAYYKDYSGKYSVYNSHAGVCRDFVNIFALMCRELGVPTSSMENRKINHTWSIVWLNGRWEEVDVTNDIRRSVHTQDVTDVTIGGDPVNYREFLTPGCMRIDGLDGVDGVGQDIYCGVYAVKGRHVGCPHAGYSQ